MSVTANQATPASSVDLDQINAAFGRDGYVILRDFYDPATVAEVQAAVERYANEVAPRFPDGQYYEDKADRRTMLRLEKLSARDQWFAAFRREPRLVAVIESLLGEAVSAEEVQVFGKPPKVGQLTPPHQDNNYWKLDPPQGLTVWIPLDVADLGNGCVRYVRGSHLLGMRPHELGDTFGFSLGVADYGAADAALEVAAEVKPGDVIVHHGMTIHRADPNTSDRMRRAVGMVFFGASGKLDMAARKAHYDKVQAKWKAEGKT